jgi:HNH endonuclease
MVAVHSKSRLARFMAKLEYQGDCVVWTGSSTDNGYGKFRVGGPGSSRTDAPVLAHRWAYEFFVGPIPEGLVIDHLCFNRKCVHIDHLEAVTSGENLRRVYAAGRR